MEGLAGILILVFMILIGYILYRLDKKKEKEKDKKLEQLINDAVEKVFKNRGDQNGRD
jgi:preprotein translocase subunit YajC